MTSTTTHTTALRKQCQANISTNHTTLGQHSLCKFTNANKSKFSQLLVLLGQDRSDGYLSVAVTQVHAHPPIKRHGKRVSTITHTHMQTQTHTSIRTYMPIHTHTHMYTDPSTILCTSLPLTSSTPSTTVCHKIFVIKNV